MSAEKILYISNVSGKHFSYSFSGSAVNACHALGYDFFAVANRSASDPDDIKADEEKYDIKLFHIDLCRSPFSLKNIKAYRQLKKIIRDNDIKYIHCNTPVGGILGRLAGKSCKVKRVIYQAHGFHFYKGAPLINRILYYPTEKFLAHMTDAIITINRNDYELAKEKMHPRNGGSIYYVPGVGINLAEYKEKPNAADMRAKYGIGEDDVIIISSGDLIERKNYKTAIKAVAESGLANIKLCICGKGPMLDELQSYAEGLGVGDRVLFLGFCPDIKELLAESDIFLFTSKQEGLSRSLMEAMASGLPCIAGKIRGNTDMITDGEDGFLCPPTNFAAFAEKIKLLANDRELRIKIGSAAENSVKKYDISSVTKELVNIYSKEFKGAPQ